MSQHHAVLSTQMQVFLSQKFIDIAIELGFVETFISQQVVLMLILTLSAIHHKQQHAFRFWLYINIL